MPLALALASLGHVSGGRWHPVALSELCWILAGSTRLSGTEPWQRELSWEKLVGHEGQIAPPSPARAHRGHYKVQSCPTPKMRPLSMCMTSVLVHLSSNASLLTPHHRTRPLLSAQNLYVGWSCRVNQQTSAHSFHFLAYVQLCPSRTVEIV